MRVAALQFFATPFDLARNLDTAERLARQAAAQGARLLVLPACFNTGYVYTPRLLAAAEGDDGPTTHWLLRLSAELGVVIGGGLLQRVGVRVFNTLVLAEPTGQVHAYRQQRPFLWEHRYLASGHEPLIVTTTLGRVGLLMSWDAAHREVIETYRGRVDVLLMSATLPRFHRAVLNFPLGKKVYLAQLMPGLLRRREAIDAWYVSGGAACTAQVGAPLVQAALAGRLVTELPWPRLSLGLMALSQPRYWPFLGSAKSASLRATFSGASAIVTARGETLASVEAEEGYALAEITPGAPPNPPARPTPAELWPHLPYQWRLLNRVLRG